MRPTLEEIETLIAAAKAMVFEGEEELSEELFWHKQNRLDDVDEWLALWSAVQPFLKQTFANTEAKP